MWKEVLRIVNEATVDGLLDAAADTHETGFYRALRHSNEVFAAFKVHSFGNDMARRLIDDNGQLKPFRLWRDEIMPVASHYVGAWLQTEYDTAVIRAHNAADWRLFLRDKDIMPNLRWMPTTSPNPESSHREFWTKRLTLPVDDPFWLAHHPGDRWNCKCSLEQTDEPPTPQLKAELDNQKPQRGLENNPGIDGHVFSDNHPYFPDSCAHCAFYKPTLKNRLATLLHDRKKDCYNCPYINACINEVGIKAKYPDDKWTISYTATNGAYVATEKERINYANQNPQEKKKFQKELAMCKVIADNDRRVEYRLKFEDGSYDIHIDGVPADLKQLTAGASNLVKYVRKALHHQGAKAVVLELPKHEQPFYDALTEAHRKYGKEGDIYFYFADEKKLIKLNEAAQ